MGHRWELGKSGGNGECDVGRKWGIYLDDELVGGRRRSVAEGHLLARVL